MNLSLRNVFLCEEIIKFDKALGNMNNEIFVDIYLEKLSIIY
jgi:hypothetical protein